MNFDLTNREFRLLLDLVYIGNWVLNSARGTDRIEEYDKLMEKIFSFSPKAGMDSLVQPGKNSPGPSRAYEEGGIHDAIADYEDSVFFDILAEELARRDMNIDSVSADNVTELASRIEEYISEFEENGVENISIDLP